MIEITQGAVLPTKVVLKEVKAEGEKKTQSGIIIPDLQKKNPQVFGDIVLVGEAVKVVKPGMRIIYTPLAGQRFNLGEGNENEYILLDQSNVIFMWVPKELFTPANQ